MTTTGSAARRATRGGRARPAANPLVIVSDRSRLLMVIVLVSCALTIALTRLFLALTGYPQIGNSTFHIAHALWGGLFLLAAGIIALVVQNRGAALVVALLTGIGFGLFVDEVGKFITQRNDYFFPLAAPIIYGCLVVILLVTELAGRHQLRSPRAHLLAAIDLSQTVADGTVTHTEMRAMSEHIRRAREDGLDPASAALLDGIETALTRADQIDDTKTFSARTRHRLRELTERWLPADRARRGARLALLVFCLFGIVELVLLLSAFQDGGMAENFQITVGDRPLGRFGQGVEIATWALGFTVAVLSGMAIWAMRPKHLRREQALRYGYTALLLLLLLGNLLSSYVSQFTILAQAAVQVAALGLLARWDRATRPVEALSPSTGQPLPIPSTERPRQR
jgi:hypothetical protein